MTKAVTFRVRVVAYVEIDGVPPSAAEQARSPLPLVPTDAGIIRAYDAASSTAEVSKLPLVLRTGGGRHRELRSRHDVARVRALLTSLGAVEVGDPEEAP